MPSPSRTPAELKRALENQLKALAQSVRAFEAGDRWEATRIAVAVANLVYSKRQTVSILDRVGVKDAMVFAVSGWIGRDGNYLPEHPLVSCWGEPPVIMVPEYKTLTAHVNDNRKLVHSLEGARLSDWWSAPVYKTGGWINPPKEEYLKASVLTRQDIIMTLRDQEGGAHYDESIKNEVVAKLLYDGTGAALVFPDGRRQSITGVVEATAAQIGHETLASVMTFYPEIPGDIGKRC